MVSFYAGRAAAGLTLLLAGTVVAGLVRPAHAEAPAASSTVVVRLGCALVQEFDARPFPPAERHERVFHAFDALKAGQGFIFTNDHDPKPLYYQLEAESLHPFLWEYLESGPEVWKVRVARVG